MTSLRRTHLILLLILALGSAMVTTACNQNQDGRPGYHLSQ